MASKLVTIPSNSMIPERDIDKSPILECINLGIQFGGLKAVDDFNLTIGRTEQMRLDNQVYGPLLLNQCTAAIRTLSTHIIQPVIQIFRKGKRHIPLFFQFRQLVLVRSQGTLVTLFCFFPG